MEGWKGGWMEEWGYERPDPTLPFIQFSNFQSTNLPIYHSSILPFPGYGVTETAGVGGGLPCGVDDGEGDSLGSVSSHVQRTPA
jgi:hypothetical protein